MPSLPSRPLPCCKQRIIVAHNEAIGALSVAGGALTRIYLPGPAIAQMKRALKNRKERDKNSTIFALLQVLNSKARLKTGATSLKLQR